MTPHSKGEFYALVSGERLEKRGAPARAAWEIERLASLRGWPTGESLGSEAALRERLGVSRETVREAIRIVEGRGAMRMRRGRSGGLILARPTIARMGASFAAYLRATRITQVEFEQSVRGFDQLLAWQIARKSAPLPERVAGESARHWLARASGRQTCLIYISALAQLAPFASSHEVFSPSLAESVARRDATGIVQALAGLPFVSSYDGTKATEARSPARAAAIAMALIERANAAGTVTLGNEASLCEDSEISRSILRQALRILQDLDLIQVQLGRGGGYTLKRPAPIGIIRQMFVWLAARNCDPFSLYELMWDLGAANLRLAGEMLGRMPAIERDDHCDRLDATIAESVGLEKLVCLRQGLAAIAQCPMIDTLSRCMVSYQVRSYGELPEIGDAVFDATKLTIAKLRMGDLNGAEGTLRRLLGQIEELAIGELGLRVAAE